MAFIDPNDPDQRRLLFRRVPGLQALFDAEGIDPGTNWLSGVPPGAAASSVSLREPPSRGEGQDVPGVSEEMEQYGDFLEGQFPTEGLDAGENARRIELGNRYRRLSPAEMFAPGSLGSGPVGGVYGTDTRGSMTGLGNFLTALVNNRRAKRREGFTDELQELEERHTTAKANTAKQDELLARHYPEVYKQTQLNARNAEDNERMVAMNAANNERIAEQNKLERDFERWKMKFASENNSTISPGDRGRYVDTQSKIIATKRDQLKDVDSALDKLPILPKLTKNEDINALSYNQKQTLRERQRLELERSFLKDDIDSRLFEMESFTRKNAGIEAPVIDVSDIFGEGNNE